MEIYKRKNFPWQELDDELLVLNTDLATAIQCNQTAAEIWKILGEPVSHEQILEQILINFDIEKNEADADLRELLVEMKKQGILD